MVIFISPGKKAGFHAVGAFILVSNDKGSRETETRTEGKGRDGRKKGGRGREAAKTLKLWAWLFKKPYTHENTNNRPLVLTLRIQLSSRPRRSTLQQFVDLSQLARYALQDYQT